jgi:hypothetical protein
MTFARAPMMTGMKKIREDFVQIQCNDQIVLIHHEVTTARSIVA